MSYSGYSGHAVPGMKREGVKTEAVRQKKSRWNEYHDEEPYKFKTETPSFHGNHSIGRPIKSEGTNSTFGNPHLNEYDEPEIKPRNIPNIKPEKTSQKSASNSTASKPQTKLSKAKSSGASSGDVCTSWDLVEVLTEHADWPQWAVANTVRLLEEENTVPFIARYRKEQTANMEADKIRHVKDEMENLKAVQHKILSVYKAVEKLGQVKPQWRQSLISAQTLAEVEHLYAPFKPGNKRTLAERAKELGLEPAARGVLTNPRQVNLQRLVQHSKEGVSSMKEVQTGVQHILADIVSKDKEVMDSVRQWCKTSYIVLKSTKAKTPAAAKTKVKGQGQGKVATHVGQGQDEAEKYKLYFDFSCNIKRIRPHQILAINRGVSKKLLTTKLEIPDSVEKNLLRLAERLFIHRDADRATRELVVASVKDAYQRLIEPLMVRQLKAELSKMAEKASIEVFASNLKRLLLTPPVRGKVVLGVDPGFKHGCKCAVVSVTGQVLDTAVFYPHTTSDRHRETDKIARLIHKHRCETVAIGNGTACRETEAFFSDNIKRGVFRPLQLQFCIVSESGASIYSASPEAAKEMPDLDVSLRGAVSIARRLQDPMAELVKIEPKHIGVGMYQHDISEAQLKTSLDGVIEDCVSFVGVDLNLASEALLRRIAGLTSATAKKILAHRDSEGAFVSRDQLTGIKGLGPKTYKQCAGFVRVLPLTRGANSSEPKVEEEVVTLTKTGKKRKAPAKTSAKSKKAKLSAEPNSLDMTAIHPESYDLADRLIADSGLDKENIGTPPFIANFNKFISRKSPQSLASDHSIAIETLTQIVEALKQSVDYDIREEFEKPLFKEGVRSLSDLRVGDTLTGRVTNAVHFGAFVDIGVGQDGLIHSSQMAPQAMAGRATLELGDKVKVTVGNLEVQRKRIGLRLVEIVS